MQFDDFSREIIGDVLVENVNFSRATFKEAEVFREIKKVILYYIIIPDENLQPGSVH